MTTESRLVVEYVELEAVSRALRDQADELEDHAATVRRSAFDRALDEAAVLAPGEAAAAEEQILAAAIRAEELVSELRDLSAATASGAELYESADEMLADGLRVPGFGTARGATLPFQFSAGRPQGMSQAAWTVYLKGVVDAARAWGYHPKQYARALNEYWFLRAANEAGIDVETWDPKRGAAANRGNIEAVYNYYSQVYLTDPDLQWAGMARMIGPSFAAGFLDLNAFRRFGEATGDLPWPLRHAVPHGVEVSVLANLTAEDLHFYESKFLSMQKEIFRDQGSMHQAYLEGGMPAIREMGQAGLIGQDVVRAWTSIDSGDPSEIAAANTLFLRREQLDIIDDDYQDMYRHPITGPAMTWAMTQVGTPSIPDAQGFADFAPVSVNVPSPGPSEVPFIGVDNPLQVTLNVETPFAGGNVTNFDYRWGLIEEDTLLRYQELIANDPERARQLIGGDLNAQIDQYRLDQQVDEILIQLADWDLNVHQ